jgi:hypothetical protein
VLNRSLRYIIFPLLLWGTVYGQEIKPSGRFLADSIKIGEKIPYALTLRYPRQLNVVFPDSTYDFSPFEYAGKTFFPTKSNASHSFDSVVYYLTTFEVEQLQSLKLPIFIVSRGDSTAVFSEADGVHLSESVKNISSEITLKENTTFTDIHLEFNYPYFMIGISTLAILTLLIILLFGKKISAYWQIMLLRKAHRKFLKQFGLMIEQVQQLPSFNPEQILLTWKNYMEKVEEQPYVKFTTREIITLNNNSALKSALMAIDKSIYAMENDKQIPSHLMHLKDFASQRLENKIKEIKNV